MTGEQSPLAKEDPQRKLWGQWGWNRLKEREIVPTWAFVVSSPPPQRSFPLLDWSSGRTSCLGLHWAWDPLPQWLHICGKQLPYCDLVPPNGCHPPHYSLPPLAAAFAKLPPSFWLVAWTSVPAAAQTTAAAWMMVDSLPCSSPPPPLLSLSPSLLPFLSYTFTNCKSSPEKKPNRQKIWETLRALVKFRQPPHPPHYFFALQWKLPRDRNPRSRQRPDQSEPKKTYKTQQEERTKPNPRQAKATKPVVPRQTRESKTRKNSLAAPFSASVFCVR